MNPIPGPINIPPPISANGERAFWSSCVHYNKSNEGSPSCLAPGQSFLFPAKSCAKCKQFARREP